MEPWRSPDVPRLPGVGQVPFLHDHSSGERRLSARGDRVGMYVCGITPYDATHIGHSATYVAFDLLCRAWRDAGLTVRYVQNVTDVDDPLLERANQNDEDWRELAARQVALFRDDMAALRTVAPDVYVGAVEAVPMIVDMIDQLRGTGATYELDGDLYFDVSADPAFGQVSAYTREEMLAVYAERGGDPDRPGKRDPLDCLLWLRERPGEPAWDSPFGPGRPGWHVECAAIALEHLGIGFDVQAGGSDLAFPHHEMCASEAQVLTGTRPFAHTYAYQGMVGLDGEKMSKSKGNLVFSAQLRADGVDPMAIRLAVLSHHYREDWEWTADALSSAERRLDRWRTAVTRSSGADGGKVVQGLRDALADDLDAPTALAVVDEWADATLAEPGTDDGGPALVRTACDALLGVRL